MTSFFEIGRRTGRCIRQSATVVAALAGIMAWVMPVQAQAPAKMVVAPVVDHHLHLGSPALADYVEAIDKQDPTVFEHLSRDVFSRPTPATALAMMDEAGVKRAVLLSSGYLYMTGASAKSPDAARKMREENRFAVDTALASHGRFITFIAINPFAPNAMTELNYWKGKPGVSGIKLHLGAAGFHASSRQQVATLAKFFATARAARLPIVAHLRGGGSFTKGDVETFIGKVLSQAGNLPVQIAHGGGYAGADPATIASLAAFGAAIARKAPGTRNLVFDISGVVLPEETAKALGSNDAQLKIFVSLMRRIGLNRFVIGSDWPALGRIAPYFAMMREKLPLSDAEWTRLCKNEAPYLRGVR